MVEVAQQAQLAQGALGVREVLEHFGHLFDGDLLARRGVACGAKVVVSAVVWLLRCGSSSSGRAKWWAVRQKCPGWKKVQFGCEQRWCRVARQLQGAGEPKSARESAERCDDKLGGNLPHHAIGTLADRFGQLVFAIHVKARTAYLREVICV